jgi:plasmid stabilization system protein ParE
MPLAYHILIPPKALRDLVDICSYVERQSPQNAASVARQLLDSIDSLAFLPRRYEVHENRRDPALTVHSMSVPPFIVYYRVDDDQQAVRVLAIRHGARRQPRRFR